MSNILADVRYCIGHCLKCKCLGDRIMGQDVDAVFAYQTPKVVKIQDRSLGILRIISMLAIFLYIFIYHIWYKGEHFLVSDVEGIARLEWQHPTKHGCNPMALGCESNFVETRHLPYCQGYTGSKPERVQRQCGFYDARELPVRQQPGQLLPTHIREFRQVRSCNESASECSNKFTFVDSDGQPQTGGGGARPSKDVFVVDVDDFTVLIDHSFRSANGKTAYDDFSMQGYYTICEDQERTKCERKRMKCAHDKCDDLQGSNKRTALEGRVHEVEKEIVTKFLVRRDSEVSASDLAARAVPASRRHVRRPGGHPPSKSLLQLDDSFADLSNETELSDADGRGPGQTPEERRAQAAAQKKGIPISMRDGDVFSLKMLLDMAGISLDASPDPDAGDTRTIRERGTAIVVRIAYNNMHHWQLYQPQMPPEYTVSVTRRPVRKFKDYDIISSNDDGRVLRTNYGVYIIIQQTGRIGTFDVVNLLVTLTAMLALLAASNVLTDIIGAYLLPRSDIFLDLKYEVSENLKTVEKEEHEEEERRKEESAPSASTMS